MARLVLIVEGRDNELCGEGCAWDEEVETFDQGCAWDEEVETSD